MSLEGPLSQPLKPWGAALGAQGDAAMIRFPLLGAVRLSGTLVLSC